MFKLTSMHLPTFSILPREVDPLVYNMSMEDPGGASFAGIGGLGDQIRELREVGGVLLMSRGYRSCSDYDRSSNFL